MANTFGQVIKSGPWNLDSSIISGYQLVMSSHLVRKFNGIVCLAKHVLPQANSNFDITQRKPGLGSSLQGLHMLDPRLTPTDFYRDHFVEQKGCVNR